MGFRRKLALWICPDLGRSHGPVPSAEMRVGAGMNEIQHALIELCDLYAKHRGISHWRVSYLVRGDGMFFRRLKEDGAGCTLKTAHKVAQWFSDHWPDQEVDWPAGIERPSRRKEAA